MDKKGITAAGPRLKAMNDALEDPMAWLAFAVDGSESNAVYSTDGEAHAAADAWGWQVMPLYLAPRLTDAEREAVEWAVKFAGMSDCNGRRLATLRGLLARLSEDGDCPAPDKAAERDNTPPAHPTPAECTVSPECTSRPYWVDPPSGWQYGFPKLYDPATDGNMRAWMIANGYPKRLANLGLPCTFTEWTEDVG